MSYLRSLLAVSRLRSCAEAARYGGQRWLQSTSNLDHRSCLHRVISIQQGWSNGEFQHGKDLGGTRGVFREKSLLDPQQLLTQDQVDALPKELLRHNTVPGEAVKAHPLIQSTIRERTLHVGRELQKAYKKGMLKLNEVLSADSTLGHVTKNPKLLGFDEPKMLELMHLYEDIDIDHEGGNVYFSLAATNHLMNLFQCRRTVDLRNHCLKELAFADRCLAGVGALCGHKKDTSVSRLSSNPNETTKNQGDMYMRRFYSSGFQKHTTPPSCNHTQARKLVNLIDDPGCLNKGNYIQKQTRIRPDSCLHTFHSSKLNAARKSPRNMCTRRFYSAGSPKHTTPPPFDPKQWKYLGSHVTGDELPQQIKHEDPSRHAHARKLINLVDIPGCLNKKGKHIQKKILIATDSCLHTLRSVPLLVRSCHLEGKCLSNLSMDSTFINSYGEFELNLDVIEYKEFDEQNVAADWNQASHLAKEYLRSGKGMTGTQITYPADLRCWFTLMESSRSPYDEYLICTHASLLPLGNKGAAYLRMFDKLSRSDPIIFITQMAYLSMPKKGWQNSVRQNYFLRHWLQFRKYGQTKAAYLGFFRNVLSHIRDHFGLKKLIDFLIYANSPTLLCDMQLALSDTRFLGDLGLEELFPDKYVRRLKFWHKLFRRDSKE